MQVVMKNMPKDLLITIRGTESEQSRMEEAADYNG